MADLISIPIFALMIPLLGIFGISFVPQTSVEFERVTNNGISDTMVQSVVSTVFNEENSNGVKNYKAFSYKLCGASSSTAVVDTELDSGQPRGISGIVDYMSLEFDNIPSQCSSESSYTKEGLFGVEDPRGRTYTYDQKIPVLGGDVVDMKVRYEVAP